MSGIISFSIPQFTYTLLEYLADICLEVVSFYVHCSTQDGTLVTGIPRLFLPFLISLALLTVTFLEICYARQA